MTDKKPAPTPPQTPTPRVTYTPNPDVQAPKNVNVFEGDDRPAEGVVIHGPAIPFLDSDD